MPNRLAGRDIGLRRDRRGVDDQHIALPLADRITVQRQVRLFRVPTAVGVNPPHAVAFDLAQPGDAARRSGEVKSLNQPNRDLLLQQPALMFAFKGRRAVFYSAVADSADRWCAMESSPREVI
jgi:hypothetical protein